MMIAARTGNPDGPRRESGLHLIQAAAEALGGLQRVRAVRTMRLRGRAQYGVLCAGGSLCASRHEAEQSRPALALERVYDFEHGRYQQLPWRPAFPSGSAAADASQVLDPLDGTHMRCLWMLNNPVALVRAALQSGTELGAPREDGNPQELCLRLAQGDTLAAGFSLRTGLPEWVRWRNPHPTLGEVSLTTHWSRYVSVEGLWLPLAYDTRLNWRDIDYLKLRVQHYGIDEAIEDSSDPQTLLPTPEAPCSSFAAPRAEPIARHLWQLSASATTVIEFHDHLALFNLQAGGSEASSTLALARTLIPDKPMTQLIVPHPCFSGTAGLRQAVAEGLTIIGRAEDEELFSAMVLHPVTEFPDELARSPQPLRFLGVKAHLCLKDDLMRLDLFCEPSVQPHGRGVLAYAAHQPLPASNMQAPGAATARSRCPAPRVRAERQCASNAARCVFDRGT